MNHVFVLGGGVAGLTAAHELSERNFNVTLFERNDICGGKARSMPHKGTGTGGNQDWPAEHGFRFFPGFYFHLTDTMKRIVVDSTTGKTADQNLVAAKKIAIAQEGKPLFLVNSTHPKTILEWIGALRQLIEDPSLGIPFNEGRVFLSKVFCFLGAGRTRRLTQYEQTSWWDFIEADLKSDQYKAVLARGLSQSLVAMRPDKASTLTVGSMLVQILLNIIQGDQADRVLNAPTNEAWIDPWVKQLASTVSINTKHVVTAIQFDAVNKVITGIQVKDPTGAVTLHGDPQDYYVAALPIDVVQSDTVLFPTALKRAAGLSQPATSGGDNGVDKLDMEWMNGVLFYMNRDVSAATGHVIYAHSRWALTSVSQRQFWRGDFPWAQRGNGQANDILSTIISDWDSPGNKVAIGKTAKQCLKQEIIDETWEQLKAHLTLAGNGAIKDGDRVSVFLDPAIQFDPMTNKVSGNTEPLLVNTKGTRVHRPVASTKLGNFFVASDYVLTETDLACMEAANEAARQAVNALLQQSGSAAARCKIKPLEEPALFRAFQAIDENEFPSNPTQPPLLCRFLDTLLPTTAPTPFLGSNAAVIVALITAGVNLVLLGTVIYLLLKG
jgi:15-cis-phytoene desaturase